MLIPAHVNKRFNSYSTTLPKVKLYLYELCGWHNARKPRPDAIDTLKQLPKKHELYEEELWSSMGVGSLPLGNNLIFDIEMQNLVSVICIMYDERDK